MKGLYMVEIVRDDGGRWFWKAKAPNGKVISFSGQSYTRKWFCRKMARKLLLAGLVVFEGDGHETKLCGVDKTKPVIRGNNTWEEWENPWKEGKP